MQLLESFTCPALTQNVHKVTQAAQRGETLRGKERSEEGKERVGGRTECKKTEMGLGKIGEPRGLRAPHRSRVNGNVLLRAGARLPVFLLSAHGTKQVVQGVVGPRVGNDSCQDSAVPERES